jgi:single-strand DNA-binding protein
MGKSINQWIGMGNLTRDPDLKQLPNGQPVTSFSIALNRSYKGADDEWVEETDFIDVVTFGKLADQAAQNLMKGTRVLVQGRLKTSSWDDKETGKKRSKVEILAHDLTFLHDV